LLGEVEIADENNRIVNISTLVSELTSNTIIIRKIGATSENSSNSESQESQKFDSLNQLLFCRGRIENQRGLLDKANLVGQTNIGAI